MKNKQMFVSVVWVSLLIFCLPVMALSTDIQFTQEEQAWLEAHPVIRIQNEKNWAPFNFFDHGKAQGLSIDYMDLLAKKIGIQVEYITGPSWDEFLDMAKQKQIDVILNIVETDERKNYLLFTNQYLRNPKVILSRKASSYSSLEALKGKKVAVPKGFFYDDALAKSYPGINRLRLEDTLSCIKAVAYGEADATLGSAIVLQYLIAANLLTGLEVTGEAKFGDPNKLNLRMGVRDDWPILQSILEKAMRTVSPVEMRMIQKKWIGLEEEPGAASKKRGTQASSTLNLTPAEKDWLDSHRVVKIINDKNFPPFDFYKGESAQGYSVDLMEIVADLAGFEIEWESRDDWDQALKDVRDKKIDALHSLKRTKERMEYLLFTDPYYQSMTGIFVRFDNSSIRDADDLASASVAIPKGYSDIILIKEAYPDCTIIETESAAAALKAVAQSEADSAVLNSGVGNYLANDLGYHNLKIAEYLFIGDQGEEEGYTFGVRNDWPELISIVEKAIAAIPPEQVKELRQQWMLGEVQKLAAPMAAPISYMQILMFGVGVLSFLLLLALVVLKFIKAERVSAVFGSKRFRMYVLFSLTVFVLVVVAIGWLALGSIRLKVTQNIDSNLRGSLKIANYALEYWVRDRKSMIKHLSHSHELSEITQRLLAVPHEPKALLSSPALQDARAFFENDSGVFNNIGFFIIGPDYVSLGSKRDGNIGTTNLIAEQRPDLIKRAFNGEILFVPPIRSDVQLEKAGSNTTETMSPTMFFIGPIEDSQENIIAVFTLRVDSLKGFTKALQVVGDSYSQETYAFNKNGVLLTKSRFEDQLRHIGLLEEGQSSAMHLMLKDPGVNLMEGETPIVQIGDQPLTLMAEQALSDQKKSRGSKLNAPEFTVTTNIDGYRDYRGVPVLGAWLWDANLEVGVAVEIDADEALSSYDYARNILVIVLGLTMFLSTSATLLVLVLGQRTSRLLARAKDSLEDTVAKRTSELAAAGAESSLILSSMGEGLIKVDTLGKATFVNTAALNILGYSEGDLLGHPIHDIIHHSYADGSHYEVSDCPMNKSFSDGVSHNVTDEVLWKKDGTSLPVEYSATPIMSDGVVTGAVIVFQDVTERRKAEHELENSKEQLQHILDTSPIAVAFSTDGIIHFTNPAFEAQYGVKVGDGSPNLYVNTADREEIIGMLQRDGKVSNHEVQMFNKDNDIRDMLISYLPISYEGKDGILGWLLDITERKQSAEEIQRSQNQLLALFEALPVGVTLIGPAGEILESNSISSDILGISNDKHTMLELQSQEWKIIRLDGSVMPVEEYPASRALAGEQQVHSVEMGVIRPQGDTVWISTSAAAIDVKSGGGVAVAFEDITERKQTELRIAKNEAKFRLLFEAVSIPLCYLKGDGTIVEINSKFTELFGYTLEDVPTVDHWFERAYPDPAYRKWVMETWGVAVQTAQESGTDIRSIEYDVTSKSGEVITLLIAGTVHDGSMLATFIDITERKKMEAAMAGERDRLQEMMNTSPVGIAISVDGVFRFANNEWSHQTGLKVGDVAAKAYVDPESRKPIIEAIAKYGKLENHPTQLYGADGSIHDMLTTYYSFDYEGEKGVLGWCVDVTEMKDIETELRIKFDELERFRKLAVGRETKMIELKKEINALLEKEGGTGKYKIH